ncbi:MAG: NAD-dependent epimerase/dehydratase family protein [Gammaproteobacteria bacterium]|nr:NAD-dependent epimerase/dehydratase family protein [Gammaproteobacteria bacterium]
MKIFVTGGSGFVGGATIEKLTGAHQIIAMSRSAASDAKIQALGAKPIRSQLGQVKLTDIEGCDIIIHAAAHIGPWGSREQYWQTNVEGTVQLLDVAKEAGIKRFIHIGTESGCFYGQDMHFIDETYPLSISSPYFYSETKAEAERQVLSANDSANSFITISLRPRFIWGLGDQTILPELVTAVEKGHFMWISGGHAITSSTNIHNLTHAIELSLENGKEAEAYFIVDEKDHSFRELLTALLATQNLKPSRKSVPSWIVRGLAGLIEMIWNLFPIKADPPITRFTAALMSKECSIRSDKALHDLGYQPVVSMQDGFEELRQSH